MRTLFWLLSGFLLALVLWIGLVGISVDVSPWRNLIADKISASLSREVWLRGDIRLELGRNPAIHASRVHIRNTSHDGFGANGFADIDWLYVGQADVQFDAMHYLFTGALRFQRINADNVAVFLEARPDGVNNWEIESDTDHNSVSATTSNPDPAIKTVGTTARASLAALSELVVDELQLNRLHVEYKGPDDRLRLYSITRLTASAPAGEPVTAQFRGVIDSLFPFSVEFTGGALSALVEPSSPWPVTVATNALGTTMTLDGAVEAERTTLQLGWGTPDPAEAGRILQVKLPDVGPTALAAQITVSTGKVRLQNLRGWIGVTQITGDITVLTDRERPYISGELAVPVLDLKPFMQGRQAPAAAAPPSQQAQLTEQSNQTASIADWYRERADDALDLTNFGQVDADLKLSVGRWLSLPGNVRDAGLHVQLADGKLTAPVKAQLAGVRMLGNINIDGGRHEPRIELSLGAQDTELGELAQFLFGLPGVRGHLQSIAIRLEGRGQRIAQQVDGMTVHLSMAGGRMTYGNSTGQKPVAFSLYRLKMDIAPGEPVKITSNGSLLDQPLDVVFTGAPFRQLLTEGQSRIDLHAKSRSMQARVRGTVGQKSSDGNISTQLFLGVSALHARDAAPWFGIGGDVNEPFSIAGNLSWDGHNWAVRDARLGVGRSKVRAEIEQLARGRHPLVRATIAADTLNIEQIQALFANGKTTQTTETDERSMLNIPVLPTDIDLTDTDLSIRVKHVTRAGLSIRDLSFDAMIRDGRMAASPLAVTIEQVQLSGAVELDLRSKTPRGQWWLTASDVNVGQLLQRLKVADNLDAKADLLSMHLDVRGNKLGEALNSSSLTIAVTGGELAVKDRNTGAAARFTIDAATVQAPAGKPLQAKIRGSWNKEAVQITLGSARAVEFLDTRKPIPFNALLQVADTELEVFGKLGRDFGAEVPLVQSTAKSKNGKSRARKARKKDSELKLNMLVNGKRLDSLNGLSGVALPPWGPYEINGVIKLSSDGYEVPNLSLKIGDSQLDGTGYVLTTESPPRVDVLLNASQLQINDFKFGDWKPTGDAPGKDAEPVDDASLGTAAMRRQAHEASEQTQALLSEKTLRSVNGGLRLTVNDVRSGQDKLGSGSLRLNVFDGAATIGPIRIQLPDSSASLKLNYAPDDNRIDMRTQIKAEQFDYGFLARRVQPDSTLAGRLSLDVDISAATPSLSQAMEHSSGVIGFDVWPENVQADVFDLWATNLFLTLATRLDPSSASKINCGVVRFSMKDGLLTHQKILLDTTRVRVAGEGSVNFKTQALTLKMQPLPKKAEFFSLATPIIVNGSFDDYTIGANPGDIAGTALRLATSLVWVPLKKLFGRTSPGNGSDICGDPGRFLAKIDLTVAEQSTTDSSGNQLPATRQTEGQIRAAPGAKPAAAAPITAHRKAAARTPVVKPKQKNKNHSRKKNSSDDLYIF